MATNEETCSSPSLSGRKSLRKPAPEHTAAEEETKKKKKKLASPMTKRIWNEDDELAVLKGLVDYRAKTEVEPKIDWDAFLSFVGGSINGEVSKEQLLSKIRKLKRKFRGNMEKINQGKDPLFTRSTDSEAFGFSMMIWGKIEPESGEVANVGNGPKQSDFDRKESHDDDELSTVRDAFETLMWQGLSDYQKKLQLEKLINLGSGKRKELSNEWKDLCAEHGKLILKKLTFFTKLAEAANNR